MVIFVRSPEILFSGMVCKSIFSLSVFWIPVFLYAQDVLVTTATDHQAYISFVHPETPTSIHGNSILIQLATARDESPRRLKIGIAYSEMLRVSISEMKSPEVTIRFTHVHTFKAPSYRDFSMEEALTPDLVTCNLNLIDLPDSNIIRQYRLMDLRIDQLATGYTSSDIPVVLPGKFTVTLSDITFHYSHKVVDMFRKRIQLINDYYASSALTDSLLQAVMDYTPLTTNDLPGKFIMLMEVNRIVKIIGRYQFDRQLPLHENDPRGLVEKFIRLDKFSRSATMTFEQQVEDPARLTWSGTLKDLSETYVSHLIVYIHRSMLINGVRGGIYKEYLDSYFQIKGFENEERLFYALLSKMFPGDDSASVANNIFRTVWDAYLHSARRLIGESDYVAAIILLEHANVFQRHTGSQELPDGKPLQADAVKGIYASFLGIAESCIDLQMFQKADEYIDLAGKYLADYKGVIPTDTMFQRVFLKLFDRRLQSCDYLLAENRYQEALDCYQLFSMSYPPEMITYVEDHLSSKEMQALKGLFFEARDLVLDLISHHQIDSALICYDKACAFQEMISRDPEARASRDDMAGKLLPIRYKQLSDRATYLFMTYNHEEAYTTFNQLKEVGAVLGIPFDTTLERMYTESYKHHMLNEISVATGMIWKNELDSAKEYVQQMESVMDLYNLDMDPDLQAALNSYRQKIDLKICLSVKDEAETISLRAMRNLELKHFDVAVKLLGDARQKVRLHPECDIDLRACDDTIKKYLSAAFYQEKQQQALNQLTIGNFQEAMKRVHDNERFYINTHLTDLGVPFVSTLDFVAQSSRVPMFREAIPFFLQSGDVNSAWICLTWLKREGLEARDVKEIQERVGYALASLDFVTFSGEDPEGRVRSYTGGNRWFVKFAQAYTGRWAQLQSEKTIQTP